MKICLLDVGSKIYGDCILVTHGSQNVLIDCAHKGDDDLIRSQLEEQLGHAAPFHFDLIVVTHCHADHIGCLPELVGEGDVTATWALMADEELGFGQADAKSTDDFSRPPLALTVAMQEENYSGLSDDAIAQFLSDAATLPQRYRGLLQKLQDNGTKVVRYNKDAVAQVRQIESEFAELTLQVLGPTPEQLQVCAEAIAATSRSASDLVSTVAPDMLNRDSAPGAADLVEVYRCMMRPSATDAFDGDAFQRRGMGAKNDQSIILTVEADGWKALLAGDMQFASPEVDGLDEMVSALLNLVDNAGPYDFIKTAHHTSNNGLDADIYQKWSATSLFGHSGGSRDPKHPNSDALKVLKEHAADLTFGRTDHNGLIAVEKSGGQLELTKQRGRFNDFRTNPKPTQASDGVPAATEMDAIGPPTLDVVPSSSLASVEVTARIPHVHTRVTVAIEVEPSLTRANVISAPSRVARPSGESPRPLRNASQPNDARAGDLKLQVAPGRKLPKLLVVSNRKRLSANIGVSEAQAVFSALKAAGTTLVEVPDDADVATDAVVPVLAALRRDQYKGVLIVGGYDVVPPMQLDVLDANTRAQLEALPASQRVPDAFVVWTDGPYGDTDADLLSDLPVTRVPDGRRADVLFAALSAPNARSPGKFAIRNSQRPFADGVFPGVPGAETAIQISAPFLVDKVTPGMGVGNCYYMLHGADWNGASFWGEAPGQMCEAWNASKVPKSVNGSIVFTGCCFAGLTSGPAADQATLPISFRPRGPEASIAIAYLQAGALAFVGCTGSHYSPSIAPYQYYGQPLHVSFWRNISNGLPAPEALFSAKREYVQYIPHGHHDINSLAIELKTVRQYTCLGLGW